MPSTHTLASGIDTVTNSNQNNTMQHYRTGLAYSTESKWLFTETTEHLS